MNSTVEFTSLNVTFGYCLLRRSTAARDSSATSSALCAPRANDFEADDRFTVKQRAAAGARRPDRALSRNRVEAQRYVRRSARSAVPQALARSRSCRSCARSG